MDNVLLDKIEKKINNDEFESAQQLLQGVVVDELPDHQRLRYFFLLAKVYFEQDVDDLVMPTLQHVFENADEFVEIDRAYLMAAVHHVFQSEEKDGDDKQADLRRARDFFDKIMDPTELSINEQDIYYFRRGLLELYSNQLEESIQNFKMVLTVHSPDGDMAAVHGYLAGANKDLKNYDEALHHYDLAINNTKKDNARHKAFLKLDKARLLDTIGLPQKGISVALDIIKEFEEDEEISMYSYGVLGYAFYSKKEYDESLIYFNRALEIAKATGRDTTNYLFRCAINYRFLEDFDTAEKLARDALAGTSDGTYIQLIYVELFRQYMYSDRYEKAIEMLQNLIEKYPDYEDLGWAYLMIGHMHSLLDKHREAIDFFAKSLQVPKKDDEDRISALDFTAYCHLKLDDVDKAMEMCLEIIDEYLEGPNLAWAHAVLARCYFEKGMKIEAREQAEKAQQYKPPESEVYSFGEKVLEDILKDLGIK